MSVEHGKKKEPLISVIVPVYNTEQYLPRCLDSILSQSFTDFELLIVDDGSTDGSETICDTYAAKDSRVRVFHKENGGVSSARNLGLQEARGEWVCFVDSDDELLPDGLQTMVNGISEEVDMVMAGYIELEGDTFVIDTSNCGNDGVIDRNDALLMMYPSTGSIYMGYPWGKLYRRNIILGQGIMFDEHIRVKEDTLFIAEYLRGIRNQIYYTNVPVYKYVQLPTGVMGGLHQSYNPNYLHSFDVVVRINGMIQSLPHVSHVLSQASKYEVVNRIYLVYGHMLENDAVDRKVISGLKIRAIREVGLRYYLGYQYRRNKRRIMKFINKKMNVK